MRAIKFRGKPTDDFLKWVYGDLITFSNGAAGIHMIDADGSISVNSTTVGQFTGLLDKNQSEVYDGDIIKAPSGRTYLVMWSTWIHQERRNKWIVDEYQFTGWCIGYKINRPIDTLDSEVLQGEVIGNIYDNPELITP